MTPFLHLIFTRFNVRLHPNDPHSVPNDQWMQHRFELFERYTLPGIRKQTNQNFKWLIFFDSNTSEPFKAKIETLAKEENILPFFVDEIIPNLKSIIQHLKEPEHDYLITTRLDNDDALNIHYIENIQNRFSRQNNVFLNFTNGFTYQNGKLYTNRKLSNPFITRIEPFSNFNSVWCNIEHTNYHTVGRIEEIETEPQWLQVIHETNLKNRLYTHNIRVPLALLENQFVFEKNVIPNEGIMLNLGSGDTPKEGYLNVDLLTEADMIYDLNHVPYPWQTNSVELIRFEYSLEHLGEQLETFFSILMELYRISKNNAELHILATYPKHDHFLNDPSKVRPINPEIFEQLSQNSPQTRYLGLTFEIIGKRYFPDSEWQKKLNAKEITETELIAYNRLYHNVIESSETILKIIKE